MEKPKHIRCADCAFAVVDRKASEKGWTAFECGYKESAFYKSLLNIASDGSRLSWISWGGCPEGLVKP